MKLCVISDTWGKMPVISGKFDIFIHCGNFLPVFKNETISWSIVLQEEFVCREFNQWLDTIDAKYKIVIPGQNDYAAQFRMKDFDYHLNAIFLCNEAVTLNGILYYGMPYVYRTSVDERLPNVFTCQTKRGFAGALAGIPDSTNVLITRTPPLGIMDVLEGRIVGSKHLASRIRKLKKLKTHVFGMAKDSSGGYLSYRKVYYLNACSSDIYPYRMVEIEES